MQKKIIKLEIYGEFRIIVVISDNPCKARNKYSKILGDKITEDRNVDGMLCYNDDNPFDLYLFLHSEYRPGVIAHESFHATCRLMDCIHAYLDESSEESYAYMITYLVDKITAMYNK